MHNNRKHWTQVLLFAALLGMLFTFAIGKPNLAISQSERRPLQQFPRLSGDTLRSGSFMKAFDQYSVDQFPFRETFRSLHASVVTLFFRQTDQDGLYLKDSHVIAMEYPLQTDSLAHASGIFQAICERNLKGASGNLYLSIIPDKSYFLQNDSSYLTLDYNKLVQTMRSSNPQLQYIDITHLLDLDDYYKTDPHWKQERLLPVAEELANAMNVSLPMTYEEQTSSTPFFGAYAGQSARPLSPDTLHYLWNPQLSDYRVFDHQNQKEIPIYDTRRFTGRDPYEAFLSGPLSYITIENPKASTTKELVIFRDSFASPLAPLLASGYQKITLLDIRYLPSKMLEHYIQFNDQDVLFLYSTSVLNHSETLK